MLSGVPMDTPAVVLAEGELLITAEMARLALTDEERASLRDAIGQMLTYFDQMRAVDVSGVVPTTHAPVPGAAGGAGASLGKGAADHAGAARPPLRPDAASASASRWPRAAEQALVQRAGDSEDGFVTTPNVL